METPTKLQHPPPAELVATRVALHRLSAYVIAPVRYMATGRFGLRALPGGFGTPSFDDRVVRVHGSQLIDQHRDEIRSEPITTLQNAADFLGSTIDPETAAEHDTPPLGDTDDDLRIDEESSTFLGEWFMMAFEALEVVRSDDAAVDASPAQLWPGHFDAAIDEGDEDHRASYGASPGDASVSEPYLYVSAWWPDKIALDRDDPEWNATSFVGSMLPFSEFLSGSPVSTAADFWSKARERLAGRT